MEELELQTQLAHVVRHPKAVRQRGQPIDHVLVGVRDQALAERMLAIQDEVDDASHRVLGEQGLLVQVHNPIAVVQHIHRVLETVLQGPGLEERSGARLVLLGHHNLTDATML